MGFDSKPYIHKYCIKRWVHVVLFYDFLLTSKRTQPVVLVRLQLVLLQLKFHLSQVLLSQMLEIVLSLRNPALQTSWLMMTFSFAGLLFGTNVKTFGKLIFLASILAVHVFEMTFDLPTCNLSNFTFPFQTQLVLLHHPTKGTILLIETNRNLVIGLPALPLPQAILWLYFGWLSI